MACGLFYGTVAETSHLEISSFLGSIVVRSRTCYLEYEEASAVTIAMLRITDQDGQTQR